MAPLFPHSHQRQCYHSFAGTIVVFLGPLLSQTASACLGGEGREGRELEPFLVETQAPPPVLWGPPVFERLCQCFTRIVSCSCCDLHNSAEKQTRLRSHRQSPLLFYICLLPQRAQLPLTLWVVLSSHWHTLRGLLIVPLSLVTKSNRHFMSSLSSVLTQCISCFSFCLPGPSANLRTTV